MATTTKVGPLQRIAQLVADRCALASPPDALGQPGHKTGLGQTVDRIVPRFDPSATRRGDQGECLRLLEQAVRLEPTDPAAALWRAVDACFHAACAEIFPRPY